MTEIEPITHARTLRIGTFHRIVCAQVRLARHSSLLNASPPSLACRPLVDSKTLLNLSTHRAGIINQASAGQIFSIHDHATPKQRGVSTAIVRYLRPSEFCARARARARMRLLHHKWRYNGSLACSSRKRAFGAHCAHSTKVDYTWPVESKE